MPSIKISEAEGIELEIEDDWFKLFMVDTIVDDGELKVMLLRFAIPSGSAEMTLSPADLKIIDDIRATTNQCEKFLIEDEKIIRRQPDQDED